MAKKKKKKKRRNTKKKKAYTQKGSGSYNMETSLELSHKLKVLMSGGGQGVPNPRFPPPLAPLPSPSPPLPYPSPPTSLPSEYFFIPHRKRQFTSSCYLSFRWVDYFQQEHQSKTVGVCLIVPPFIYLVL